MFDSSPIPNALEEPHQFTDNVLLGGRHRYFSHRVDCGELRCTEIELLGLQN